MSAPAAKPALKKMPGLPLGGKKAVLGGGASPASSPGSTPRKTGIIGGALPAKQPAALAAKGAPAAPLGLAKAPALAGGLKKAIIGGAPAKAAVAPPADVAAPKKLMLKKAVTPGAPEGVAAPAVKAPLKLAAAPPSEGAAPTVAAPAKLPALKAKVPGKALLPLKLPLKSASAAPSVAPSSAAPSVAPDENIEPSPRMEGTREEPSGTPIATPRDMPTANANNDASPSATPMMTPRPSGVPPPPDTTPPATPRDDGTTTPSAIASPRIPLDEVMGAPSPRPPAPYQQPPGDARLPTNPPSPNASVMPAVGGLPPYVSQPDAFLSSMRAGEWPSHRGVAPGAVANFSEMSPGGRSDGGGYGPGLAQQLQDRIDELESNVRQLERKLIESEKHAAVAEQEATRLRETLYDREGAKVVQHMAELERENRKLRATLQREKDGVLYHQNAHMATMDELVKLKHTVDVKGDYDKLKVEHDRLTEQVTRLVRANTELSLKVAEVSEQNTMLSCAPVDHPAAGLSQVAGGGGTGAPGQQYVMVRRGALCVTCQEMVDRWDRAVQRRQHGYGPAFGTAVPQSPIFNDPVSNALVKQSQIRAPATIARAWTALRLDDGKIVYHNTVTNQSQWEMPAEMRRHGVVEPMDAAPHTPSRSIFAPSSPVSAPMPMQFAAAGDVSHFREDGRSAVRSSGAHYDATSASPYAVASRIPAAYSSSAVGSSSAARSSGAVGVGTALFSSPASARGVNMLPATGRGGLL